MARPQVDEEYEELPASSVITAAVRESVRARCIEHARLKVQEKRITARCDEIATEVDRLLAEAGLGEQLLEGFAIDGHRLKLVAGETKSVNWETLIRLGCDPQWIDKATERKPRKAHVRFTHPADEG